MLFVLPKGQGLEELFDFYPSFPQLGDNHTSLNWWDELSRFS